MHGLRLRQDPSPSFYMAALYPPLPSALSRFPRVLQNMINVFGVLIGHGLWLQRSQNQGWKLATANEAAACFDWQRSVALSLDCQLQMRGTKICCSPVKVELVAGIRVAWPLSRTLLGDVLRGWRGGVVRGPLNRG